MGAKESHEIFVRKRPTTEKGAKILREWRHSKSRPWVRQVQHCLIQSAGRWDGLSDEHTDELYESYKTLLDDLGIDREPIETFWHATVEYDYSIMALGGSTAPTGATDEERERWDGMRRGIENRASPDEVRAFLTDTGYITDEREELVLDLEYFRQHHEHRRPEEWATRKKYYVNNPLKRPDR